MIEISKEKLEPIYRENGNVKAAKMLGITQPTLIKYVDAFGIQRKGKGNRDNQDKRKIVLVK